MFDKLILPFRFVPDGSPEAQVPPPPGHIRIRAVFRHHSPPHPTSEETENGWFNATGLDDATNVEAPPDPGPAASDSPEAARSYPDPVATYLRVSRRVFGQASGQKAIGAP